MIYLCDTLIMLLIRPFFSSIQFLSLIIYSVVRVEYFEIIRIMKLIRFHASLIQKVYVLFFYSVKSEQYGFHY